MAERQEWKRRRDKAYKESSLPYSFNYKIRNAFYGKPCPICGCLMKVYIDDVVGCSCTNRMPTIQHNRPIADNGKHELGNISVICKQCNVSLRDCETKDLNEKEVEEIWARLKGS